MDASHETSDDEPQDEESEVSPVDVEIDAEVDEAAGGERRPREESSALPVPVSSESSLPEATEGRAQATALTAFLNGVGNQARTVGGWPRRARGPHRSAGSSPL